MSGACSPMPITSRECAACAGTGQPSPWEHDYHIWLEGRAIAVCGACRGAGNVGKWGFPLSPKKQLAALRRMSKILRGEA